MKCLLPTVHFLIATYETNEFLLLFYVVVLDNFLIVN